MASLLPFNFGLVFSILLAITSKTSKLVSASAAAAAKAPLSTTSKTSTSVFS
jgi:hypothetical protein